MQDFSVGNRVRFNHGFMSFVAHDAADKDEMDALRAAVGTVLAVRPAALGCQMVDVQWDEASLWLPNITTVASGNLDLVPKDEVEFPDGWILLEGHTVCDGCITKEGLREGNEQGYPIRVWAKDESIDQTICCDGCGRIIVNVESGS